MSQKLYPICCTMAALLINTLSTAMPARKGMVTAQDPDGQEILALQYGDENFHYYVSEADGSLLIREGDIFYPADISGDGRLVKSGQKIEARKAVTRLNDAIKARNKISGIVEGTTFPAKGKQKVAVVLVEYQDVKFNLGNPLDYFTRMLNEEGFSDYHATGSARDWFMHSSGGLFEPEFDVFGPITLQQRREYYGGSDAYNHDRNPQRMVIEACRQLNASVDFSQYDCDGDGFIDNVFVVYAGRGEASGGSSDCVWPHAWRLSVAEPGTIYTFDGVRLDRYACCNEWELSELGYGYRPVGIGTFVHEFSHVMGLPDLYSTEYATGSFTAGAWSAMDYGPYNNDGCTPPQYSAWERAALGYIDIPTLSKESANIALEPLENGGARLIPTENENEYFIIENRRQTGWDEFIPGHGMLLWHIDYDKEIWKANKVNNDPSHNHVDIVEADGTRTEESRNGDCFPGISGVTSLSANTDPALVSWKRNELGFNLTDISERFNNVLIRVNGGSEDISTPENIRIEDIHAGYFNVLWNPVKNACGYTVRIYNDAFQEISEFTTSGDASQLTVTGLEPSTEYTFTVCAEDGMYGSIPSVPLSVRTLDPTFDYFAPVSLAPSDLTETSFTARWEKLDGAHEYFLTVYRQDEGESTETSCGFDNGAESLPQGWTSSSNASYGMSSYCGENTPSLRLSKDGDYMEISCNGKRSANLSFWHRGNGTGVNEKILIDALAGEEWQSIASSSVTSEKGGKTISIPLSDTEFDAVRIIFDRPDKGALAIDDVCIRFHGDYILNEHEDYNAVSTGNVNSFKVENLEPRHIYYYDVYAYDGGEYTSLRSERIKVDLNASAGTNSINEGNIPLKIYNNTIESSLPTKIYDISGRLIWHGSGTFELKTPGIYIVHVSGYHYMKLYVS